MGCRMDEKSGAPSIVKQCFWVKIKFNTEDSNAIHTIITTRYLKLNEVMNLKLFTT